MRGACRPLGEYRGAAGDVLVYHYATASAATAVYRASPARKVVRYHNITPAEFFAGYDDAMVARLTRARAELAEVCSAAGAVWADSQFNAAEVAALGARGVRVLPVLFSPRRFETAPDPAVLAKYSGPLVNILFVGRMAPNKRVEELILAFAHYTGVHQPFARLILVGSDRTCPRYFAFLRLLAWSLGLPNVCFEGFASEAGLAACYRAAHLYVCPSDHEGYCLPLVEALHHDVPVLAKDCGGMPEALGNAGVLYAGLGPAELAALMHRLVSDPALRAEVLETQRLRRAEVHARDARAEVAALLAELGRT
jgi:glycosyltransferase involved in cell wall biosynthesis